MHRQRHSALNYYIELTEIFLKAFVASRSELLPAAASQPNDIPGDFVQFWTKNSDIILKAADDATVRLRHALPAARAAVVNVDTLCCFITGLTMQEARDIIENTNPQQASPRDQGPFAVRAFEALRCVFVYMCLHLLTHKAAEKEHEWIEGAFVAAAYSTHEVRPLVFSLCFFLPTFALVNRPLP
jgi:hypothetical protein